MDSSAGQLLKDFGSGPMGPKSVGRFWTSPRKSVTPIAARSALAESMTSTEKSLSLQKFIQVGDVIAQVDLIHVGLLWAGIRVVLQVRVQNLVGVAMLMFLDIDGSQ